MRRSFVPHLTALTLALASTSTAQAGDAFGRSATDPLGSRVVDLNGEEAVVIGPHLLKTGSNASVIDNAYQMASWSTALSTGAWSAPGVRRAAELAQLDDDAPFETVVAWGSGANVYVGVLDPDAHGHVTVRSQVVDLGAGSMGPIDIAVGEMDEDGRDEVAIARGGNPILLDDMTQGMRRMGQWMASFGVADRVAIGDVTGDGRGDLVALDQDGAATLWSFAPDANGFRMLRVVDHVDLNRLVDANNASQMHKIQDGDVHIGDVDGDEINDVAIVGIEAGGTFGEAAYTLSLWTAETGALQTRSVSRVVTHTFDTQMRTRTHVLRAVRLDLARAYTWRGEYVPPRLVVNDHLFTHGSGSWSHLNHLKLDAWVDRNTHGDPDGRQGCERGAPQAGPFAQTLADFDVKVGDFDRDGYDDVAFVGAKMCAVGIFGATSGNRKTGYPLAREVEEGDHPTLAALAKHPNVIGIQLESTGVTFSDPTPIAVVAAPPCSSANDNFATCRGFMKRSDTSSQGSSEQVTVSARAAIGLKITGGAISQTEATIKAVLHEGLAVSDSTTQTVSTYTNWSFDAGVDHVAFVSVPYDVFVYRIVSDPVGGQEGQTFSYMRPRRASYAAVSVDEWNGMVSSELRIPQGTFTHHAGNPATYKGLYDLPSDAYEGDSVSVGGAEVTAGIGFSEVRSRSATVTFGAGVSAEVVAGGVLAGFEMDVTHDDAVTTTVGTGLDVGGTLHSLDAGQSAYTAGPFARDVDVGWSGSGRSVIVLDWWVQMGGSFR